MSKIDLDEILDREEVPVPFNTKELRWQKGKCKLCGEHFDVLTYYHIGLHGYDDLNKFIEDGNVEFDFERRGKRSESKNNRT